MGCSVFLIGDESVGGGVPIQRFLQGFSSPMEARHYGAHRNIEDLRNLLVTETFHVGKEDGQEEAFGEIFHRVSNFRGRKKRQHFFFCTNRQGREPLIQVKIFDFSEIGLLRSTLFGSVTVDECIGENTKQPCSEVRSFRETFESSISPQVGLLYEISSIGFVARHSQCSGVETFCMLHRFANERRAICHFFILDFVAKE